MLAYLASIIGALNILNNFVLGISAVMLVMQLFILSVFGEDEKEHKSARANLTGILVMLLISGLIFLFLPSKDAVAPLIHSLF